MTTEQIESYPTKPPPFFRFEINSRINLDGIYESAKRIVWGRCPHNWEPRRAIASDGRTYYKQQCAICGANDCRHLARSRLPPDLEIKPFDENLYKVYKDNQPARWAEYHEIVSARLAEIHKAHKSRWWQWYDGYLRSPIWRRKRTAVMARSGGVCEICRSSPATEVHHETYDNVGREPLTDLVAVCHNCHTNCHAAIRGDL